MSNDPEKAALEAFQSDVCESIQLSVDISRTNTGSKAIVRVKGAKNPLIYFFTNAQGELVSQAYRTATVENLKPGKYNCVVKDAADCRKKIEFEVK